MTSPTPLPFDSLEPTVQRNVGPQAPLPLKMMTARGLAPMAPRDLVTAQYVLTFDPDEKIRTSAEQSLAQLDLRIANAVLGDTQMRAEILGYLAQTLATNDAYAERVLLNPKTPSWAFIKVAEVCSETTCEIIANNQARLLEDTQIAKALVHNPNALKSTVDRVADFLVRSGVVIDGVRHFEDALLRLTGEDRLKAIDHIELPRHLLDDQFLTDEEKIAYANQGRQWIADDDENAQESEEKKSIEVIVRGMTGAQKVALATKGNKAARSLLMRDTNRLVALAAVTSPAITEPEVLAAANSRTVHQDVVAHIARDKKNNWIRNYQIKVALVNNPKAPLAEAMKLVPTLQGKDLKLIAKSRNVQMGVRTLASKLVKDTRN